MDIDAMLTDDVVGSYTLLLRVTLGDLEQTVVETAFSVEV